MADDVVKFQIKFNFDVENFERQLRKGLVIPPRKSKRERIRTALRRLWREVWS